MHPQLLGTKFLVTEKIEKIDKMKVPREAAEIRSQ
jgi:hypothetical protein